MKEIWKDIKDYEGLYQVSNLGRVKSLSRMFVGKNGVEKPVREKILALGADKKTKRHPRPHFTVELWKDNKRKRISIHRLVALAFIPNPYNKPQVNHIDGNPGNNNIENLEWVTNSENVKHAYAHNLITKHNRKCIKGINIITGEVLCFESVAEAARHFNVTPGAIRSALKGYGRSKGACGCKWEYQ